MISVMIEFFALIATVSLDVIVMIACVFLIQYDDNDKCRNTEYSCLSEIVIRMLKLVFKELIRNNSQLISHRKCSYLISPQQFKLKSSF
jgi:hypothetical protein